MKTFKELINICNEAVNKEDIFEVNIVTSDKISGFTKYDEESFSHNEEIEATSPKDAFNKICKKFNLPISKVFNSTETKTDSKNYIKVDTVISSNEENKTYFIYIKRKGFDDSNVMLDDE